MASASSGLAPCATAPEPFRSAADHIFAELERLKLLLRRQVLRLRAAHLLREDQFRGLYISDEEVDALLCSTRKVIDDTSREETPSLLRDLTARSNWLATEIAARAEASLKNGVTLPLAQLRALFSLSDFDYSALLVCAAPEVDARFEILYAYVQNDVTRKYPTPDLILKLLCESADQAVARRSSFSSSGPLLSTPLLRVNDDTQHRDCGWLSRGLRAESRIVDFILGVQEIDARLRPFTRLFESSHTFTTLHLPSALLPELQSVARNFSDGGAVIFLSGPAGSGKQSIAQAISRRQSRPLLTARMDRLPPELSQLSEILPLLRREAIVRGANLFLASVDTFCGQDSSGAAKRAALLSALDPSNCLIFVGSASPLYLAGAPSQSACLSFDIPPPDFSERSALWKEALAAEGCGLAPDADCALLANKFQFTGGRIKSVCRAAADRALVQDAGGRCLSLDDLVAAAKRQSNHNLERLAQRVTCADDWSDLVLPPRPIQELREVCAAEKYRYVVYSQWGYGSRLTRGKGINALFCGASGTGKTMAAGIIARDLALDLYKIDLSAIVSKYIGETEKQLNQIFQEARTSNTILFFDEADALFGKRSEVKDAHDRYANIETAYLLQKMEEYEGIVILATNFRRNMDEAFTRRMHHIIDFPFPDAALRERIWRGLVPTAAPLAGDVQFAFLARQFELSGGNIRNASLTAAFLAAEAGEGELRMEHYIQATARELLKLGRVLSRTEFRQHFEIVSQPA
ncbi:MAG: AAA family ATPase [Candidatus Acidiferrum sp.]